MPAPSTPLFAKARYANDQGEAALLELRSALDELGNALVAEEYAETDEEKQIAIAAWDDAKRKVAAAEEKVRRLMAEAWDALAVAIADARAQGLAS